MEIHCFTFGACHLLVCMEKPVSAQKVSCLVYAFHVIQINGYDYKPSYFEARLCLFICPVMVQTLTSLLSFIDLSCNLQVAYKLLICLENRPIPL